MRYNGVQFRAGGTIGPAVFVKLSTAADNTVLQAGAGDPIIGISQVGQRRVPGLAGSDPTIAAIAGEFVEVFIIGDVAQLTAGAAFTRGDFLMSDANGDGITATTVLEVGAVALQSAGAAGVLVNVLILSRPAA